MRRIGLAMLAFLVWTGQALAEDPIKIEISIRDHRFEPAEIHVPMGKPALLTIRNDDATAEEFESAALKVEKVVPATAAVTVRLRPLGPGRFPFLGDYHPDTAQGVLIADDKAQP